MFCTYSNARGLSPVTTICCRWKILNLALNILYCCSWILLVLDKVLLRCPNIISYTFYVYFCLLDGPRGIVSIVDLMHPVPHCKEDSNFVFLEIKLRGLVPNFYIHTSVSDLYIPRISPPILLQPNRQTNRSQICTSI
jgi:hypothetical protein